MSLEMICPCCGEAFMLREARSEAQWQDTMELLLTLPSVIQGSFLQYGELFKPPKQRSVRSATLLKLLKELQPLILSQQLLRNRTTYQVSFDTWSRAMVYLFERRSLMQLPLKGNGYLFSTIANYAEKRDAEAEQGRMVEQRQVPPSERHDQGGFKSIGAVMGNISTPVDPHYDPYKPAESDYVTADSSLKLSEEEMAANSTRLTEILKGLTG